jgi:hypothetical protein
MELKKLNRFTSLPVLLDLLKRKRLVLLDPAVWEDKNDSEIMSEYQKRKRAGKLFALCFSQGDETIHHWKTFADGISGCCIEFDAARLENHLTPHPGIRHGPVKYKKITEVDKSRIEIDAIPFTKRWPYRCEEEYRIIWEGDSTEDQFEIGIDLHVINKITISQRMPVPVYNTIREYLREAFANPEKRINRSTIYANQIWIAKFKWRPPK